ncbi:MAG: M1 family metallopeptidase, partial [Saprospiraceae bacterium]|nr:M1 family metallopeptidase [Saprospiraceae bacterium]
DYAFKEYSRRWAFKHPTPADFFRTMEDASGVDLDWFWRGWFYGIEPVDIALDSVKWYKADIENNPQPQERTFTNKVEVPYENISKIRNKEAGLKFSVEEDTELVDFYTTYKPWETEDSVQTTKMLLYEETFSSKEKQEMFGDKNYYELYFSNKGGLPMPIILEWTFKDGTKEVERIPAEIWRKNEDKFAKVFVKEKEVSNIKMDPFREIADIDELNNTWPAAEATPSRFQVYKQHKTEPTLNPMQKAKGKKVIRP